MQHVWQVTEDDVRSVTEALRSVSDHWLVNQRQSLNLAREKPPTSRERFWHVMLGCLLTSQQPSGEEDPVMRFLDLDPFPLHLSVCESCVNLKELISEKLSGFGGIQYYNNVARYAAANLPTICGSEWTITYEYLERLRFEQTVQVEREVARFFDDRLTGFGPKQARNLLHWLGLTRYEIPLDSRVMRWLIAHGFSMPLTSELLQDKDYYELIEDALHELCRRCGIFPCVLDAVAFELGKRTTS